MATKQASENRENVIKQTFCYLFSVNHLILVRAISEEFKLLIINCMTSLMSSITFEVIEAVYIRKNVPKFSQIIYVCSEIAKSKTARNLR